MNDGQKVLKGLKSQSFVVIILGVIDLLYFSLMSRLLSKEEFGLYAVIIAITTILTEITNAGLSSAIIQKKNPNSDFIATAFTLSVIFSSISSILLITFSKMVSKCFTDGSYLTYPLIIMSFAMFFSVINGTGRALYMKNLDFFKYGMIQILSVFVANTIGVFMAYKNLGLYAIVTTPLLSNFFICFYLYGVKKLYTTLSIRKKYVNEIVAYGGWLTASGIVRSVYEQLDKLITSFWLTMSQLGAYNRPSGFLTSISGQVNGVFDTILFPILSNIQDDYQKIARAYEKAVETIVICAFIFSISLIICSNFVICAFMGAQWLDITNVYILISISVIFLFYNRIADCFFRSLGIVRQYFNVRVVVCVGSILLICVGCRFGILGLAIAVLFSRVLDTLIKIFVLRNKIVINHKFLIMNVFKKCLPLFLIFVIVVPIKFYLNSVLGDILSIIIYGVLLITLLLYNPYVLGDVIYVNLIKKINALWIRNLR